jgi:peroxiredoxin
MMMQSSSLLCFTRQLTRNMTTTQVRNITMGTDMRSSVISLQKARPWYMGDTEGSNNAADNAVTLEALFKGKTVAIFGVPAPFTGTCSNVHYPEYKKLADDILGAGVDEIVCYAVSDPYAHDGWSKALENNAAKITFLADPDGSFAKAYGMDAQYDEVSLGLRCKRFSMIVSDCVVATFRLVDDAATDAQTLLEEAKELEENIAV